MKFKILCIIPARGGSKGIPLKNIQPLGGKPLIAWTIQTAIQSKCADRVVVSTDNNQIAEISKQYGAEVPFMRPSELSQDNTPAIAVLEHTLLWFEKNEQFKPDYIMLLYATSPLRTVDDITNAVMLTEKTSPEAVISVCNAKSHPYWCKKITKDGYMANFIDDISTDKYYRKQDLPPAYILNGSIYIISRSSILDKKLMFPKNTVPYIMPEERSIDIDALFDLKIARVLIESESYHG